MINSILILGDSVARGVVYDENKKRYTFLRDSFANKTQSLVSATIHNISRFGATIRFADEKLDECVEKYSPDLVFFEFGGNDCDFNWNDIAKKPDGVYPPGTELEIFESELARLVSKVLSMGKKVLLTTLPPLNAPAYLDWVSEGLSEKKESILKWLGDASRIYWWHERYSCAISRVAALTKVRLIDVRGALLSLADFRSHICRDGIHLNEAGHKLVSSLFETFIKLHAPELINAS